MATYTPTVVLDQPHSVKGLLPGGWCILTGVCTVNPYSQTPIAIGAITGQFKPSGILRVVCDGVDASGLFLLRWDPASGTFKAYAVATGAQAAEGATTIGAFGFHAIGQMG